MLITTCPHCSTQFYVSKEQMSLANGQVRCGRCRATFDVNTQTQEQTPEPETGDNYPLFDSITEIYPEDEQDTPPMPELPKEVSLINTVRGGYQFSAPRYLGSRIELSNTKVEPSADQEAFQEPEDSPAPDLSLDSLGIPSFEDSTYEPEYESGSVDEMADSADSADSSSYLPKVKLSTGRIISIIALLIFPAVILPIQLYFYGTSSAPDNIALISSKIETSADQANLHLKLKVTKPSTLDKLPKMQLALQNAQNQTVSRIYLKPEQYLPAFNPADLNKPVETHLSFKLKQPQDIKSSQITWVN